MNLSLTIVLDDQEIIPNQELSSTLNGIITSYIRQTLGGKKIATKGKKPKDPNAPVGTRIRWTDEEVSVLKQSIGKYFAEGMDKVLIWEKVASEMGKTKVAIYQKYKMLQKENQNA